MSKTKDKERRSSAWHRNLHLQRHCYKEFASTAEVWRYFISLSRFLLWLRLRTRRGESDGQDIKSEPADGKEAPWEKMALNDIFIFQSHGWLSGLYSRVANWISAVLGKFNQNLLEWDGGISTLSNSRGNQSPTKPEKIGSGVSGADSDVQKRRSQWLISTRPSVCPHALRAPQQTFCSFVFSPISLSGYI